MGSLTILSVLVISRRSPVSLSLTFECRFTHFWSFWSKDSSLCVVSWLGWFLNVRSLVRWNLVSTCLDIASIINVANPSVTLNDESVLYLLRVTLEDFSTLLVTNLTVGGDCVNLFSVIAGIADDVEVIEYIFNFHFSFSQISSCLENFLNSKVNLSNLDNEVLKIILLKRIKSPVIAKWNSNFRKFSFEKLRVIHKYDKANCSGTGQNF